MSYLIRAVFALLAAITFALSMATLGHAQDTAGPVSSQLPESSAMKPCSDKNPPPCVETPPKAIYPPDPEYSRDARKAKVEGTVILWAVVGVDGRAHDIRVSQAVGRGLDEQAIKTLKEWRFKPGTSRGTPVPALISVQIAFSLGR